MPSHTLNLISETETLAFGRSFARMLIAPCVVYLSGDLGAGKTTFTRGFLQGLGYVGIVKSPTYNLVESYKFQDIEIHHFDLYRFTDPYEWLEAGLDELFTKQSIILIEWPDKAEGVLPHSDLDIALAVQNEGRMCTINAHSINGKQCLSKWLTLHAEDF